jgi:hypothetical protein
MTDDVYADPIFEADPPAGYMGDYHDGDLSKTADPPQQHPTAELLTRIKRHWYRLSLDVEELPAGREATALTIAVSDLREVIQKVPGCEDFWRHPFDPSVPG